MTTATNTTTTTGAYSGPQATFVNVSGLKPVEDIKTSKKFIAGTGERRTYYLKLEEAKALIAALQENLTNPKGLRLDVCQGKFEIPAVNKNGEPIERAGAVIDSVYLAVRAKGEMPGR